MKKLNEYKVTIIFMVIILLIIGGLTILEKNRTEKENMNEYEEEQENLTVSEKYQDIETCPVAIITLKDGRQIKAELYPNIAPTTVENFISLANQGYYDGLTFHRTIPDFMIQGGDPEGTGLGGPGYSIIGEFRNNGYQNDISHVAGILSMARSTEPDSAGSQFFITTADSTHLDGDYAGFGKIIEGLEIAKELQNVEVITRDENSADANKPVNPPVITSIRVDTFGVTYDEPEKITAQ